jgi:hypothetical protein
MPRTDATDNGLDKLQDFLLAMEPGDALSSARAHEISGLDLRMCDAVLDALMRAGLMIRVHEDAYVRVRLEHPERYGGKTPINSV